MADPDYRDYSDWMDRNGPITRLLRWPRNPQPAPAPAE